MVSWMQLVHMLLRSRQSGCAVWYFSYHSLLWWAFWWHWQQFQNFMLWWNTALVKILLLVHFWKVVLFSRYSFQAVKVVVMCFIASYHSQLWWAWNWMLSTLCNLHECFQMSASVLAKCVLFLFVFFFVWKLWKLLKCWLHS